MRMHTEVVGRRWRFPKIHLLALVVAFTGALLVIFLAGQVISSLNGKTETEAAFTNSAVLPTVLLDAVSWQRDASNLPREMDPLTREAVTVSWLRAWEQLSIVSQTQETAGVEAYFSNDARTAVLSAGSTWGDRTVTQQGHDLKLMFLSEDGQVLSMKSSSIIRRGVAEMPDASADFRENYEVVMLLEDGNWRVQHMVRRSTEMIEPQGSESP